jgi:hypothetical protein
LLPDAVGRQQDLQPFFATFFTGFFAVFFATSAPFTLGPGGARRRPAVSQRPIRRTRAGKKKRG